MRLASPLVPPLGCAPAPAPELPERRPRVRFRTRWADQPHRLPPPHPARREAAKMPFPIQPHMLRHACGFKLANDGHDTRALQHYLGHKNIQHTVRYTDMAPDRFK